MNVDGRAYRSIWIDPNDDLVRVIDQTKLPFRFEIKTLDSASKTADAIHDMVVRGAPLIGATAACGLFLAAKTDPSDNFLNNAYQELLNSRPTAVNLRWALDRIIPDLLATSEDKRKGLARTLAQQICDEDIKTNSAIGDHGLRLIRDIAIKNNLKIVNILTHCNAGWLATVDWGTALAPIFKAHDSAIKVHVWVDETRPRNQGASLTAWELNAHGVPHTVISDNAGGHLMQTGVVDLCIVGSDRTTRAGDVCNKIGTYLKALAAHDNQLPFYAALPSSTIDWTITDGVGQIPIEERAEEEVTHIWGLDEHGDTRKIRLVSQESHAANPAFDVTPRRLITGIITERGVVAAEESDLLKTFPEFIDTPTL
ncbi:MAG: S-methyl-5-thioribose-1-phosphate isomerase [Proteobacteria bacterium]|nr:S-methyl-5-thioribose-1-phosphate isomerase [Pseudomonadota bacterium]